MTPTLNSVSNILFVGCVFCGMVCGFVMIYANLRVFAVHARLLRLLKEADFPVYERLRSATWRTGMNPWKLTAFLQTDVEQVPEIRRAKHEARRAMLLLVRSLRGFVALWFLGVAVGVLAVALGSTDIRFSG